MTRVLRFDSRLGSAVALASLMVFSGEVAAQKGRSSGIEREAVGPLIAIVSLADQRLEVFDRNGRVATSAVSTGQPGYRTPTGIFSVIQKKVQHTSNIYFAEMPHMQRITWSGIAMHAGVVPGYPASHGCIRLPPSFARDFYRVTEMGMRVIVAPDNLSPQPVSHAALFSPRPVDLEPLIARIGPRQPLVRPTVVASNEVPAAPISDVRPRADIPGVMRLGAPVSAETVPAPLPVRRPNASGPGIPVVADELIRTLPMLRQQAQAALATATKAAQAERQATEAVRSRHAKVVAELTQLERGITRSLARLDGARMALGRAKTVRAIDAAIDAERKAAEQLAAFAIDLDELDGRAKEARGEIGGATDKLKAAEAAKGDAQALVRELDRMSKPVHVLVSRKTQKIYVRQGYEPLIEAPVMITEPARPLGTHVFTVMQTTDKSASWSVVSMEGRDAARRISSVDGPTAALDRIAIADDVRQRISEMLSPGSSLIVSDEGPSGETTRGTDIIVTLR